MNFSDNKPIARAPSAKDNEKPTRRTEEKISLFGQSKAVEDLKPDFFETRKRGQMSSATTVSTVAQSQSTHETTTADQTSETNNVSRKRAKQVCATAVKIGVKRKSEITLGKRTPQVFSCQNTDQHSPLVVLCKPRI